MPLTEAELNAGQDFHAGRISHLSLHTADPGSTGTSEVTGGGYARLAVSWGTASGGVAEATAAVTFDVPDNITVTHVGYWSASSGGTFRGSYALETPIEVPVGGDRLVTVPAARLVSPLT